MSSKPASILFRAALAASLVGLASSEAQAQEKRRKVLEEVIVEGEVQKPQVQMFVVRQNLDTQASLVLKETFIPKIVESVEKRSF
jgi:hypothetical protein